MLKAERIASVSYGRPGRAIELATNEEARDLYKRTISLLKNGTQKRQIIDEIVTEKKDTAPLFTELIAELANDPIKNYDTLRLITERSTAMSQFSTNRRLQLETALWNI